MRTLMIHQWDPYELTAENISSADALECIVALDD